MRKIRVVASAVVVLALLSIVRGGAQSSGELQGKIVFAPNATRTVTFSKDGVVAGSFEVPSGNWLRVSYDDRDPNNTLPPHLLDGRAGGRSQGNTVRVLDRTSRVELHGNVSVQVETGQNLAAVPKPVPVIPTILNLTAERVDVVIASRE